MKKALDGKYAFAWKDLTGDPDAGKSNKHTTADTAIPLTRGIGKSNVQLLVLTPDGRIVHALSGYVPPKELLWELEQARTSLKQVALAEAAKREGISAAKNLSIRQDKIQKAYRAHPKFAKNRWSHHTVDRDRDFVRKHPLLPVGAFKTRMLTGGPGKHFGYQAGGAVELTRGRLLLGDKSDKFSELLDKTLTRAQKRLLEHRTKLDKDFGR